MDLPADQVESMLTRWRESRKNSAVGYLSSALSIQTHGFSPADMTLVDARRFQVEEAARLTGIPAWYLGADTGSSMTYSNLNSSRRDFIDFSLAPFETAIEQRLSMEDVVPRGHHVQFSFTDFLRSTPIERAQLYDSLIRNGILTPEEARDMERHQGGPI
jgi:HK97 family phage portal protein